jgi:hypothetical protein
LLIFFFEDFTWGRFIPSKMLLSENGTIWHSHMGSRPAYEAGLKKWVKTSRRYARQLELTSNPMKTLKYAITILGPLLSSLLPFL